MRHFKEYFLIYLGLGLLALGMHIYAASLAHIIFSVIAVAVLVLAALHSLVTAMQNHIIKQYPLQPYPIFRNLPPVETMQNLLFKILWAGFILLSVSFLAAFIYLPDVWQHIQFSKLLLSILAWLLFATLLYGHHRYGWSSDIITIRTIIGVLLLAIAYFGSKLIEQI